MKRTFKARNPVYILYVRGEKVLYLHAVLGKLLPSNGMHNYWVRGLSSGQDKNKDNSLRFSLPDTPKSLAEWVAHKGATRVVKVIYEREYKGYVQ